MSPKLEGQTMDIIYVDRKGRITQRKNLDFSVGESSCPLTVR